MSSAAAPVPDAFEANRDHVFGVAYRMLGRVAEAEDVVQDTWLRWQAADRDTVRSPRAYLGTVAGRLALDRLRSARHQREVYVGPWLPEPLITSVDADPAAWSETADTLTFGFLLVLERLEPLERAVFLLREVFGYPYAEVAATVDRSESACRQIAHRAKARVRDEGRSPTARRVEDFDGADRVAGALVVATMSGDMAAVQQLLSEDIVVRSDGGRDHHAARRPVVGRHRASRLLVNLTARLGADAQFEFVRANGDPAVLVRSPSGTPTLLVAFTVRGEQVEAVHAIVNPEKLTHLA